MVNKWGVKIRLLFDNESIRKEWRAVICAATIEYSMAATPIPQTLIHQKVLCMFPRTLYKNIAETFHVLLIN